MALIDNFGRLRLMRKTEHNPVSLVGLALAILLAPAQSRGAATGSLSVFVHEADRDVPLPCRAWVDVGSKRFFEPVTASCTAYARDRSFSCDGRFEITVPVGQATLHVERGKEYRPVDREVVVREGETTKVDVVLRRWVNMAEAGWYSGDLHCHFGVRDVRVLKQLALADDVNFEPILTLWNHQRNNPSDKVWAQWPTGPALYADDTHLITLRNEEIERIGGDAYESVGALLMIGLRKPVEMPSRNSRYPCDAVLGRTAKATSPDCVIDTDKPIWGENVVGVALGLFDSVQVCHNHYNRGYTLPPGWGMTVAEERERQESWGEDTLFHRTNLTYYRFLNCGFKLATTGGSAMGVMRVPLGYSRTYAKLDGPLTEANYLKAIRAGRTFATSGPMLIFTANGLDPGAEISYSTDRSEPIILKAQLQSIHSIDCLELIFNGQVIERTDLSGKDWSSDHQVSVVKKFAAKRSGWVVARALFRASDGRLRQAHTSPIYVTVDGKPTASKTDAEFMMRWIDRLVEVAQQPGRYQTDAQRADVLVIYREAKDVYEEIARRAAETWGDSSRITRMVVSER